MNQLTFCPRPVTARVFAGVLALLMTLLPASPAQSRGEPTRAAPEATRSAVPPAQKKQKKLPQVRSDVRPASSGAPAGGMGAVERAAAEFVFNDRAAIDPRVMQLALDAAAEARRATDVARPDLLTVIDYSRPSGEPRLWVLDLDARKVLFEELVAHGRNSGDNLTSSFSNELNSRQSSLGLFLTRDTYVGSNGYSLRLEGLEPGFNDRAFERAIVMHGAPYVNTDIVRTMGRLGRSWGCPAVRTAVARDLIDTIKGGSLVFAYYPDARWLKGSRFVAPHAAPSTTLVASTL